MTPVTVATENPFVALDGDGQSIWFDSIRRSLSSSGALGRSVDLRGAGPALPLRSEGEPCNSG